jgi:MYXO-CTERM domain-containing protein
MNYLIRIGAWFSGSLAVLGVFALVPPRAHAGLDACGDIHVEAQAQCEVVPPSAACEGMCEPLSVQAACAVKLAAQCRAECDELPSVSCSGSCQASCETKCEVDPGKFDCEAECEADCSGNCEASCQGDEDGGKCLARCEGSCSASCDSHCDVELPEADCDGRCEASCEGSCEVDTNIDCQASCQAELEADCVLEVEGGCEVACETREGALFCDGQYIDHKNNLEECAAALEAALDIEVEGHAHGESSCDGGRCTASGEAEASSNCSVVEPGAERSTWGWSGLALALVGLCMRRRRHERG